MSTFLILQMKKVRERKCLARTGSGLEEGGLLIFGMTPVLIPFPRPTIAAFGMKTLLIDLLGITRAHLISGDISRMRNKNHHERFVF